MDTTDGASTSGRWEGGLRVREVCRRAESEGFEMPRCIASHCTALYHMQLLEDELAERCVCCDGDRRWYCRAMSDVSHKRCDRSRTQDKQSPSTPASGSLPPHLTRPHSNTPVAYILPARSSSPSSSSPLCTFHLSYLVLSLTHHACPILHLCPAPTLPAATLWCRSSLATSRRLSDALHAAGCLVQCAPMGTTVNGRTRWIRTQGRAALGRCWWYHLRREVWRRMVFAL